MTMRLLTTIFLMLLASRVAAIEAPFCVLTSSGQNCTFYNADSCRDSARSVGGMCIPRPQSAPQAPATQPQLPLGNIRLPNLADQLEPGLRYLRDTAPQPQQFQPQPAPVAAPVPMYPNAAPSIMVPQEPVGTAGFLHTSCLIFAQSQQRGIQADQAPYAMYCRGMVFGFISGHFLPTPRTSGPRLCMSQASQADVVQRLVTVPPSDKMAPDHQYLSQRLFADWPC